MISPDTYFQFHLLFTLPIIALLLVVSWRRGTHLATRKRVAGLAVILILAVGYTTPWDNLLIEADVWWYGEDVVWATIWAAPVGEYLFFVIQPIATVLVLCLLSVPTDTDLSVALWDRFVGLAAGFGLCILGIALLLSGSSWLYLGSMLAWGGPVLAIQWAFGWPHLWRARRPVSIAIALPTLYFWVIDWFAISAGLWTISTTHTVGIAPFGFPVEEAIFFLLTNIFVVQGYVLFLWLVAQWSTVTPIAALTPLRGLVAAEDSN
ncbi:lycopene cyclase domain-containing protein [Halovenus rubra]|uniref:Lycopene cyclase domain-containing protein n=2 Tax=Halovenus rubra TaxID=869890 RepID=A0ABD5X9R1_9EURY|nr:lycopene cyclase domain-containing protein [Halovenus rubra]